jgi:DNA gyrase subunit A
LADESKTPPGDRDGDIKPISITEEMSRSYVDYAMSVIVSRALPDVRDGLKPVHRRILYSMGEMGYDWNKSYKKSAGVVGDVMGKYHPHGDQAIYDALVRMAQDFSMRVPLIDGQGNFGSLDNDPPAQMRYTEVRLEKITHSLLDDLDKNTVNFRSNYDDSRQEPTVLPAKFPNLLVNGAGGIAVGMATNIPPHNLGEVIDATIALIDNPKLDLMALMEIVKGPDFPTGAMILGRSGIHSAYATGRGSIIMRAKTHFEEIRREREAIIITEVPYQVNKAAMQEKMAELVRDKRIEGISDIRDESDRDGIRVVIELKRDAVADVVLNQLFRFTPLQTSFGANMVALNGGRPELLGLKDILTSFVAFREEVVGRRTKFLLGKARDRAHVLVGLAIAVANIDEIIALIRSAKDPQIARERLMERRWPAKDVEPLIQLIADPRHTIAEDGTYKLSEEQARAILDLRLQRLTALGRDEIAEELEKIAAEIRDYLDILASRQRIQTIVKDELTAIRDEFATPRKTEIIEGGLEIEDEDLIQREDMVVTVSHAGYIKRVALSEYRAQKRGGKGRAGMTTREEDFVTKLFVANTHTPVLFFSSRGQVYKEKVWRLPLAAPQARGKALINMLPLSEGERITTIMPLPEDEASWDALYVMFATTGGTVRRNKLSDFVDVRRSGIIAMKLGEGEQILSVETCAEADDVILTTARGQCIRFPVTDVRVFAGRNSVGVRGINLEQGDTVISMAILHHFEATPAERGAYQKMSRAVRGEGEPEEATVPEADDEAPSGDEAASAGDANSGELSQQRYAEMSAAEQFILTVSENGFGKRTSSFEYRITRRGGKGIVAMVVNERNGRLIASFPVNEDDQIMLVTDAGKTIRMPVGGDKPIRIAGRSTQGVILFDTDEGEKVVSVEHISGEAENGENGVDEGEEGPAGQ